MPAFPTQRFGNYVLTAHLGRGGMADVFRAQRTGVAGFERTVVIKRILKPYGEDPAFVEMFINEAKIAAQLTHPNIAQVYELGEVDGEYFMALEYVRGKDLLHLLRFLAKTTPDQRSLPPDVAAYVAREILRGLQAAHDHTDEHGAPHPIVHRDVSPQNIMLAYDGQVKLVDFGIAKAMFSMREETRTGALKGKIAYMSPEQVTGVSPGPESDIFAAGVVLYEMLVGRRLFKGQNDFETLNRVKSMPIPPPSRVASWVPRTLDTVVLHALERDRGARFKRAAAMARELDEYLQAARFTIENMHEYVKATLPPEVRDEVPDGQSRVPEPSMRSRSASPMPSRSGVSGSASSVPQTNPGTQHARQAQSREVQAGGRARSGRRAMILTIGISLAVGVAGALIAVSLGNGPRTGEAEVTLTPTVTPTVTPLDASLAPIVEHPHALPEPTQKAAALPTAPAREPDPPPAREPAADKDPEPTSEHATRGSGHSPTGTSAKPAHGTSPRRPKIEVFDDSDSPKPKIETFDD